jgi:beta-N-acetylhexosaminidase
MFFERVRPAGFILFARNVDSPDQLRVLCADLKSLCAISPAPILIDQEGGRVARLRPPHWLAHPHASVFGALYEDDKAAGLKAAQAHGAAIGAELRALGITVDCLPVLDVLFEETHDVIGDRSFSADPKAVAQLGAAVAEGLLSAGVVPVIKHIPGHGRAQADSHLDLPIVTAETAELIAIDFQPFIAMNSAPMAMTAHILYPNLDPDHCATHSARIIEQVIRAKIGFEGLLMSDDLSMKALGGSLKERAQKALAAGCDIALHCNGDMTEMQSVAEGSKPLTQQAHERLQRAMALAEGGIDTDAAILADNRNDLLGKRWTI